MRSKWPSTNAVATQLRPVLGNRHDELRDRTPRVPKLTAGAPSARARRPDGARGNPFEPLVVYLALPRWLPKAGGVDAIRAKLRPSGRSGSSDRDPEPDRSCVPSGFAAPFGSAQPVMSPGRSTKYPDTRAGPATADGEQCSLLLQPGLMRRTPQRAMGRRARVEIGRRTQGGAHLCLWSGEAMPLGLPIAGRCAKPRR